MVNQSRFNRDYQLTVQVSDDKAIVIKPPFRISFSADKNTQKSLNKLNVKIYNLKADNRHALTKFNNEKKKIGIELQCGYVGNIQRIFKGSVHLGQNSREGADIITTLECQDGGFDFRYSFTSKCVSGDPVDAILKDMPNTTKGKITTIRPIAPLRPRVLVGNSYKLIGQTLTDQSAFIDDEKLHVLNDDEVVSDQVPIVQASTGLINAPAYQDSQSDKGGASAVGTKTKLTVQTMMNPALKVGGLLDLKSVIAPELNKVYKILAISYDGDYEGNNWTQTVTIKDAGKYKVL